MLYFLFYELIYKTNSGQSESYFLKGLNVFQYVTFRTGLATVTSLLISWMFGNKLIGKLKELNIGQEIREELSADHQAKKGTPTMGGTLIIGSVLLSSVLWARLDNLYLWISLVAITLFAAIGFADDYIKIVKKRSLGLTGRQKLAGQLLIAIGVWGVLYAWTSYPWNIAVPFIKATAEPAGISYLGPLVYLIVIVGVLLGSSNAVNLTDGLDGLAISVTIISMSALTGLTYLGSDSRWAERLDLTHNPAAGELTVFCGALVGASLGFLWYNAPPALVFMGDVGALAIGGAMGTVAILTKQELLLFLIAGVFVIEAVSVLMQISYFKFTRITGGVGKRIFKQAPLHHHFDVSNHKEARIVIRFVIVAILFALLSLSTLKLR